MKIPIPYQVIIERFEREAFHNTIKTVRATEIMIFIFRMPRQKIKLMFLEMKQLKLLEFQEGCAGRILKLNGKEE